MTAPVESAIEEAKGLLGPSGSALTATGFPWEKLTPQALTVDDDGNLPGDSGYTDNWDSFWLAGLAAKQLETWQLAGGFTKRLQVDGDSIEATAPDWGEVSVRMFEQSPMYAFVRGPVFDEISANGGLAHYVPTSRRI